MYITAQGPRFRNDLQCVEWDVKLLYTIIFQQWTEQKRVLRNKNIKQKLEHIYWSHLLVVS